MTSGESPSTPPDPEEAIAAYMHMLHGHLDVKGIPRVVARKAEGLLETTAEDLAGLDVEELSLFAYKLADAAYAAQFELNRFRAQAERCKSEIFRRVRRTMDPSIYRYDDRLMDAAYKHPEARVFWKIQQNSLTAALQLDALATRLESLVKVVNNLIFIRK